MANSLAYVALFLWPVAGIILFRTLPLQQALVWTILGGYMFLPTGVGIDLPAAPTLNKIFIPAATAALLCWLMSRSTPARARPAAGRQGQAIAPPSDPAPAGATPAPSRRPPPPPRRRGRVLFTLLLAMLIVGPFLTVLSNSDPVSAGPRIIPGLRPYDGFSMVLGTMVALLPLVLAWKYLGDEAGHVTILKALVLAGLIYSPLILIEVRLSPQLNKWLYGYYSHEFIQQIRGDGYRPMVFMGHGLRVAIFMAMTVLAACALARHDPAGRRKWLMMAAWLFLMLVLCKSLGALAITMVLAPAVLVLGVRGQLLVAAAVGIVVLFYPMLRGSGYVPAETITAIATDIDPVRASSLEFRLRNEDMLLDHASHKPALGWGGWGRSRVYNQETGRDISTTDGAWVITIGVEGWVGYLTNFGMLTLPLVLIALRRRQLDPSQATSGLAMVLAANLLDLIPNSGLNTVTWMICGSLVGYYAKRQAVSAPAPSASRRPSSREPRQSQAA